MAEARPTPRARLKFVLVGAVGGALILLPLGEVLRHQGAELAALADERALLDPLAHGVAVQRDLIGHRDVADRVLRGRQVLEAERRLRHAEVDREMAALQSALVAGAWPMALRENNELTQDWRALAHRITQRKIGTADSALGHQLLVEQAVQVMDLVSAAAPADRAAGLPALAALQDRIAAQQSRLHTREAAVRTQRSLVHTALGAFAVMMGLMGLAAWLARHGVASPPEGRTPNDGVRRGPGRRTTDTGVLRAESEPLLAKLRTQTPLDTAPPPPHAPGAGGR